MGARPSRLPTGCPWQDRRRTCGAPISATERNIRDKRLKPRRNARREPSEGLVRAVCERAGVQACMRSGETRLGRASNAKEGLLGEGDDHPRWPGRQWPDDAEAEDPAARLEVSTHRRGLRAAHDPQQAWRASYADRGIRQVCCQAGVQVGSSQVILDRAVREDRLVAGNSGARFLLVPVLPDDA